MQLIELHGILTVFYFSLILFLSTLLDLLEVCVLDVVISLCAVVLLHYAVGLAMASMAFLWTITL